jgi:hypothetical protein
MAIFDVFWQKIPKIFRAELCREESMSKMHKKVLKMVLKMYEINFNFHHIILKRIFIE